MMPRKNILKVILRVLSIFFILNMIHAQDKPIGGTAQKIKQLKKNVIKIKSVDPNNEDFSDLEPLKSKIGHSRIVLIGEQSHGDGTTFLAKTRLIKFLVKEMGFDVILFESGLFDCKKVNDDLKRGESAYAAIKRGVFPIWNKSQQFQPLVEFIGKYRDHLQIGGLDCQFTGEASKDFFVNDLEKYIKDKNIITSHYPNWPDIKSILKNVSEERFLNPTPSPPSMDTQNDFWKTMEQITSVLQGLSRDTTPNDTKFWIQMLESTKQQARSIWKSYGIQNRKKIPIDIINIRDIQMGKNLIWQAQTNYPKKKIIVWAATFHVVRNLQDIETIRDPKLYEGVVTMGDVAWKELGTQLYAIGFTAYEGTIGWANNPYQRTLEKPEDGSLEDLLFRTDYEYCFLDFRTIYPGGEWLRQKITSRPMGYSNMNSNWTQNMDGILFTRIMIPSNRVSD